MDYTPSHLLALDTEALTGPFGKDEYAVGIQIQCDWGENVAGSLSNWSR